MVGDRFCIGEITGYLPSEPHQLSRSVKPKKAENHHRVLTQLASGAFFILTKSDTFDLFVLVSKFYSLSS